MRTFTFRCLFAVAVLLAIGYGAGMVVVPQPLAGVPVAGPVTVERGPTPGGRCEVLEPGAARVPMPVPAAPEGGDGWVTVKGEDFEGAFPNEWQLYGDPTWDDESYRHHNGGWSGYCVGSTVSPPGPYPSDVWSWMVYGPFSLTDASDGKVDFYRWLESEAGYDYLFWGASIDGEEFYGYSEDGSQTSWQAQSFDLKNVPTLGNLCGRSQVWIGFLFSSDWSYEYEGAYLDDIVIQKYTSGGSGPDLTYDTPSGWDFPIVPSNVTGTHSVPGTLEPGTNYVDWAGRNVGDAAADDTFWIYLCLDNAPVQGWYAAPPIAAGQGYYVEDFAMSIPSGSHTLMTVHDSTDRVAEGNENNNRYSRAWTWGGGGGGDYEHVTITSSALASGFAPLGSFIEANLGLNDTVVSVSDIYASFPGRDNAEKVRNFIKDAYANWSTTHVLLGGDADVVPCRLAYGNVSGNVENIPCDLYYSDLDGSWDGDGDNRFGEPSDGIDMYPDVFVGRVPASNATSVARFVTRFTTYAGNPSAPYLDEVLLAGFDLDASTHCEATMEYYDANLVPAVMRPCNKVYDSHGGNHRSNVLSQANAGMHIWVHSDHGDVHVLGCGSINHDWELSDGDMSGLSNGSDYSILLSMACLVGAFDESDCNTEYFMNAASGGGVAAMTNSRYGWYHVGVNPQRSLSALFVERVLAGFFNLPGNGSLEDFAAGKATLVSEAASEMVYRWCMYTFNLFGEPAMPVWIPGQTGVGDAGPGTAVPGLRLAAPSHFTAAVGVAYEMQRAGEVRMTVYDGLGRLVRTVARGRSAAGRHSVTWDGRRSDGRPVPAGVYYLRLETPAGRLGRKLVKTGEE